MHKIIKKMTIEEKIAQLVQITPDFFGSEAELTGPSKSLGLDQDTIWNCGTVLGITNARDMIAVQKEFLRKSNHKIPLLFMSDIIHGFQTVFPIPLGLACSFQPEIMTKVAEISGYEAALSGIHVTFSPMADLVRDPRWGRVMESTGEDPWLNGLYAEAMVKGYQENENKEARISACVKHFAGYGAGEGGREYNTVDMSDWMLKEYYLPSYQKAIEAGVDMVMTSFNLINGIPATGNEYLIKEILRNKFNFDGVVISDWASIDEMITHGVAEDGREAAKLAFDATVDIDMMTPSYAKNLAALVREGIIDETRLDESVDRVLTLKEKNNIFEKPFGIANEEKFKEIACSPEHRKAARTIAAESMVLLKNDNILPLQKTNKIGLIGPFVKEKKILGGWRALGKEEETVSLWEAMVEVYELEENQYALGCDIDGDYLVDEAQINQVMTESDVIVLALGEEQDMSGEAKSRANISLPSTQQELIHLAATTGKPVVVVLFNGRPIVMTEWLHEVDAVLEAWFPGTEGGHSIADILSGIVAPSGRLTMSFPRQVGQIPVYYNHFNTGRPRPEGELIPFVSSYIDELNNPLFPFGYGLTYTNFRYGNIHLSKNNWKDGKSITVQFALTNEGNAQGTEVVQVYLQDVKGRVARPLKELVAFERVTLESGESRQISIELSSDLLWFHNEKGEKIKQSGLYRIYVGENSNTTTCKEIIFDKE